MPKLFRSGLGFLVGVFCLGVYGCSWQEKAGVGGMPQRPPLPEIALQYVQKPHRQAIEDLAKETPGAFLRAYSILKESWNEQGWQDPRSTGPRFINDCDYGFNTEIQRQCEENQDTLDKHLTLMIQAFSHRDLLLSELITIREQESDTLRYASDFVYQIVTKGGTENHCDSFRALRRDCEHLFTKKEREAKEQVLVKHQETLRRKGPRDSRKAYKVLIDPLQSSQDLIQKTSIKSQSHTWEKMTAPPPTDAYTFEIRFLRIPEQMDGRETLQYLKEKGVRPCTFHEVASFIVQYPEVPLDQDIIAMGSSYVNVGGRIFYPRFGALEEVIGSTDERRILPSWYLAVTEL